MKVTEVLWGKWAGGFVEGMCRGSVDLFVRWWPLLPC